MFSIKNLGKYHDLYLKADVLLLCDVFQKFIEVCLVDYGLDPCHYYSSPGLSWDAMLKMAGVKLKNINNIDIHLFLEKGMGGGVSYISKGYSKSSDDTIIMCWDASNLYGWAVIQDLPCEGFKFLSEEEIKSFNLDCIGENSKIGYILEVDLVYPKKLHDIHNDNRPEKVESKYEMLSKYCKDIVDRYDIKVGGVRKLIPNLYDKLKYVIHYKYLKYYLPLGMILIKIHRVLKFKQNNWLNIFTDFNTEKRKNSNDEFNNNLYKLLNNCIYGESIENIRKRINANLVNNKKKYQKVNNKPNFVSQKILDQNFVAVHYSKKVLTLNKPIYVGFCILELSKLLMYQFHYDYVLKKFNAKLLFTDLDSLVYEIKNGNVYEQCFKDRDLFDFSGYPKDSIYFDDSNKKVLGKMKDELNGSKIDEFVGLKIKMYSLLARNDKEVNKAKGVNLKLKHKEYGDALFGKKIIRHKMKRILSAKHSIGTYVINKISLSCLDNKRYILNDGINSLAYAHINIV